MMVSTEVEISPDLADEKRSKEAAFLVHVHSRGVGHSDEQAVAGAEREQSPLVGRVERELGTPGPAGGSARLHQQDGNRVGAHLIGEGEVSERGEAFGICSFQDVSQSVLKKSYSTN